MTNAGEEPTYIFEGRRAVGQEESLSLLVVPSNGQRKQEERR